MNERTGVWPEEQRRTIRIAKKQKKRVSHKRKKKNQDKKRSEPRYLIDYGNSKLDEKINLEVAVSKSHKDVLMNRYRILVGFIGLSDWSLIERLHCYFHMRSKGRCTPPVIKFAKVAQSYQLLSEEIKQKNKMYRFQTEAELNFVKDLRCYTRKTIESAFIIGGNVVDHYVPSLALAIENDGLVHNHEGKMKKDESLVEILSGLGVRVMSIDNFDNREKTILTFKNKINEIPTHNSLKRKQVLLRIYLLTICCWSNSELEKYFGITHRDLDTFHNKFIKTSSPRLAKREADDRTHLPVIHW